MRILIAPNAFKNSLDATAAANAIRDGFLHSSLSCTCECFPIGDGGDGTAALIIKQLNGIDVPVEVNDPLGRKIKTSFGLIDDGHTAVIEMADASGIRLLQTKELDPFAASAYGTGEMIKAALDKAVEKIIIGMGGTATVEGGITILLALGVQFLDKNRNELTNLPEDLCLLDDIAVQNLDRRILDCEVIVLSDVNNKLLGSEGAAFVFGPQKGATERGVEQLDRMLSVFAVLAEKITGKDISIVSRGGAAGGAAAGLHAFINAELVNGIDYFLSLTSFNKALNNCDLLVTGEGSIDEQTMNGKGPYGVAAMAKQKKIPVIGMAGKIPAMPSRALTDLFDVLLSINKENAGIERALNQTAENLSRAATETGNLLASGKLLLN